MKTFRYSRADNNEGAVGVVSAETGSKFLAGGTNLVDLMKFGVEQPGHLIDINGLGLKKIEALPDGGIRIGALVTNTDVAYNALIEKQYSVLSQAILAGASPQLRNMATTGGNLMQRTRCPYFYDTTFRCNKRAPGSGCDAINGYTRSHAILGTSNNCIATHPSDMCVALVALNASVQVLGRKGERTIPIRDFHLLPGDTPERETVLEHGDLITSVTLPPLSSGSRSCYLKVRDRASYEFALASAAVVLNIQAGVITTAQIAMGGVGTKPWRMPEAERALLGRKADNHTYEAAADAALAQANSYKYNSFKIELAKRTLVSALETAEVSHE